MALLRVTLVIVLALAPMVSGCKSVGATTSSTEPPSLGRSHDFDFEVGSWRVHHRTLRGLPDGGTDWVEFEGTSINRPVMDGLANLEENVFFTATGVRRGAALRSYDSRTGQWAIWWLDERYPLGPLDPPVVGRFENGVGTFFSDDVVAGRRIRTRYLWSHITATSARWEQATSADSGASWQTNWIMEFQRTP